MPAFAFILLSLHVLLQYYQIRMLLKEKHPILHFRV